MRFFLGFVALNDTFSQEVDVLGKVDMSRTHRLVVPEPGIIFEHALDSLRVFQRLHEYVASFEGTVFHRG